MATVEFSREGSPPKSQRIPENRNQVPFEGQKLTWSFILMWLKATAKLLGLRWYMVRAGEPQGLSCCIEILLSSSMFPAVTYICFSIR